MGELHRHLLYSFTPTRPLGDGRTGTRRHRETSSSTSHCPSHSMSRCSRHRHATFTRTGGTCFNMDDNDPDHATTHEFLHQHLSQQQAIHSQYPSVPPHHTSQRSKRPYSPSLDFAGFTQPSDNESDDEAFNQLTQTDPDNVADDAELSATTLRKMLRRMQKLEGAIKKLKQEKQPQGGTTSLDQIQGQSGNHAEMSSQQAHQQQQEHQRQQRRQQEEHFASLEMLQAAQMAMPLTVHPDHLSDSQTLASASNYAFDPAHIDPTLLPVSVSDGSPNAVASSSKLPPRKKRKKNKGKDGDEIGVEDDRLDADDEAGGASPLTKVRAPKPKKVHTPELNVSRGRSAQVVFAN